MMPGATQPLNKFMYRLLTDKELETTQIQCQALKTNKLKCICKAKMVVTHINKTISRMYEHSEYLCMYDFVIHLTKVKDKAKKFGEIDIINLDAVNQESQK
jgi:hypothetical protein